MKYFFANWKMGLLQKDVDQFFKDWGDFSPTAAVAVFPSYVHLSYVLSKRPKSWAVGGQNCSSEEKGAFTGEVSARQIRELGAEYVLVGHSERRQLFRETDEILLKKLERANAAGLQCVYCVGETEEERNALRTNEVLTKQLSILRNCSFVKFIAYEPVWAIGTGKTAQAADIESAHDCILEVAGRDKVVLYGGSVKPENASAILALKGVSGVLVGGASWEASQFKKIVSAS